MQSSVTDIIGVALFKWINAPRSFPLCQVTAFKEEPQTLKVPPLFSHTGWKIKLITLMIKYSVTLSGRMRLRSVRNIFTSLPVICTKFVNILIYIHIQMFEGTIIEPNVNTTVSTSIKTSNGLTGLLTQGVTTTIKHVFVYF